MDREDKRGGEGGVDSEYKGAVIGIIFLFTDVT